MIRARFAFLLIVGSLFLAAAGPVTAQSLPDTCWVSGYAFGPDMKPAKARTAELFVRRIDMPGYLFTWQTGTSYKCDSTGLIRLPLPRGCTAYLACSAIPALSKDMTYGTRIPIPSTPTARLEILPPIAGAVPPSYLVAVPPQRYRVLSDGTVIVDTVHSIDFVGFVVEQLSPGTARITFTGGSGGGHYGDSIRIADSLARAGISAAGAAQGAASSALSAAGTAQSTADHAIDSAQAARDAATAAQGLASAAQTAALAAGDSAARAAMVAEQAKRLADSLAANPPSIPDAVSSWQIGSNYSASLNNTGQVGTVTFTQDNDTIRGHGTKFIGGQRGNLDFWYQLFANDSMLYIRDILNDSTATLWNGVWTQPTVTTAANYFNSIATKPFGVAMGFRAQAFGDYAIAAGDNPVASGPYSIALGSWPVASAYYSVAIGQAAQATANYSISLGGTASGNYSAAVGPLTTASGQDAFAGGRGANASGNGSAAIAYGRASGQGAVAIANADATARGAISLGYYCLSAGEYSLSAGKESHAPAYGSIALGEGVYTSDSGETALGRFNELVSGRLFSIGNGTDGSHRHNAFSVDKWGRTRTRTVIVDTLQQKSSTFGNPDSSVVATKGYVDTRDAAIVASIIVPDTARQLPKFAGDTKSLSGSLIWGGVPMIRSDSGLVFKDTKTDLKATPSTMFNLKHNDTTLFEVRRYTLPQYGSVYRGATWWIFPQSGAYTDDRMMIGDITIAPNNAYGASISAPSHLSFIAGLDMQVSARTLDILSNKNGGSIRIANTYISAVALQQDIRGKNGIGGIPDGKNKNLLYGNVVLPDSDLTVAVGNLFVQNGGMTSKRAQIDSLRERIFVQDTSTTAVQDTAVWWVEYLKLPKYNHPNTWDTGWKRGGEIRFGFSDTVSTRARNIWFVPDSANGVIIRRIQFDYTVESLYAANTGAHRDDITWIEGGGWPYSTQVAYGNTTRTDYRYYGTQQAQGTGRANVWSVNGFGSGGANAARVYGTITVVYSIATPTGVAPMPVKLVDF